MDIRNSIPGREYQLGELTEYVLDPFWEQRGQVRQVQPGRVAWIGDGCVGLTPVGEPWDDPKPTAKDGVRVAGTKCRLRYEHFLKSMSKQDQITELRRLIVDMMDWTEQSDSEEVYITLDKLLKSL